MGATSKPGQETIVVSTLRSSSSIPFAVLRSLPTLALAYWQLTGKGDHSDPPGQAVTSILDGCGLDELMVAMQQLSHRLQVIPARTHDGVYGLWRAEDKGQPHTFAIVRLTASGGVSVHIDLPLRTESQWTLVSTSKGISGLFTAGEPLVIDLDPGQAFRNLHLVDFTGLRGHSDEQPVWICVPDATVSETGEHDLFDPIKESRARILDSEEAKEDLDPVPELEPSPHLPPSREPSNMNDTSGTEKGDPSPLAFMSFLVALIFNLLRALCGFGGNVNSVEEVDPPSTEQPEVGSTDTTVISTPTERTPLLSVRDLFANANEKGY